MVVSIIVPIYLGKKYISGIIKQVEACQECVNDNLNIELILSNDAPEEPLDEIYISNVVEIVVLNTDINRGIQGARIHGLQNATGEYILFLDQDDRIAPNFIKSQLVAIGDADAVVCRLIHEEKQYYTEDNKFEEVVTREYMLEKGYSILSPGQVLIRKSSVPEVWKCNILKNSGADDFMLWLCMLGNGARFALNNEILFEHVVNGENASWDLLRMLKSEHEMLEIIKENDLFKGNEKKQINVLEDVLRNKHLQVWDKFRKMFFCLDRWLELQDNGKNPSSYFKEKNIHRIAIYGMGYLGKRIRSLLQRDGIEVIRYMDRNAVYIEADIPVSIASHTPQDFDIVIISVVQNYVGIIRDLEMKFDVPIWTVNDLLNEIENYED